MKRSAFVGRLVILVLGALAFALVLYVAKGQRWFNFYGMATVVLVALPFVSAVFFGRLKALGIRRGWLLLGIIPTLVLAGGQVGFWTAFFANPDGAIQLGIARSLVRGLVNPALPFVGAALIGIWGCLLLQTLRASRIDARS